MHLRLFSSLRLCDLCLHRDVRRGRDVSTKTITQGWMCGNAAEANWRKCGDEHCINYDVLGFAQWKPHCIKLTKLEKQLFSAGPREQGCALLRVRALYVHMQVTHNLIALLLKGRTTVFCSHSENIVALCVFLHVLLIVLTWLMSHICFTQVEKWAVFPSHV